MSIIIKDLEGSTGGAQGNLSRLTWQRRERPAGKRSELIGALEATQPNFFLAEGTNEPPR